MKYHFTPPYKTKGFAPVEVLITLVIICTSPVITIWAIAANYVKEKTTVVLNKFYSAINQVVLKAQADVNSSFCCARKNCLYMQL